MERTIKELQAEKINVHGMPCHVGKDADRKALVQETMAKFGGRIDAFVSNAAVNPAYGPILDTTEDQWDKLFDINVKAAFLLCKGVSLPSSASAAPRRRACKANFWLLRPCAATCCCPLRDRALNASPSLLFAEVLPIMQTQQDGSVVFVSSIAGCTPSLGTTTHI